MKNIITLPDKRKLKFKGVRFMKKLGAIRSDGQYYYPEQYEYRYLKLFLNEKEKFRI